MVVTDERIRYRWYILCKQKFANIHSNVYNYASHVATKPI